MKEMNYFYLDWLVVALWPHHVSFWLIGAIWLGTAGDWKTTFIAVALSRDLFWISVYILLTIMR